MKCYICAEKGKESDAVAVCTVCGAGICFEHAVCHKSTVWTGGHPFPSRDLKNPKQKMLCPACCAHHDEKSRYLKGVNE